MTTTLEQPTEAALTHETQVLFDMECEFRPLPEERPERLAFYDKDTRHVTLGPEAVAQLVPVLGEIACKQLGFVPTQNGEYQRAQLRYLQVALITHLLRDRCKVPLESNELEEFEHSEESDDADEPAEPKDSDNTKELDNTNTSDDAEKSTLVIIHDNLADAANKLASAALIGVAVPQSRTARYRLYERYAQSAPQQLVLQ